MLAEDGIRARVVSMPCREWFDEQETAYRETVIPPPVKARVSVEAGIAQGWREVVGDHGRIVSIETVRRVAPTTPGSTRSTASPRRRLPTPPATASRPRGNGRPGSTGSESAP